MTRFEVYRDDAGEYRWDLEADDGELMATSGEGYSSKDECMDGVEIFKDGAGSYEHYVSEDGDHRWRFRTGGGQIVAASGRGYFLQLNCEEAYEMIRAVALDADVVEE